MLSKNLGKLDRGKSHELHVLSQQLIHQGHSIVYEPQLVGSTATDCQTGNAFFEDDCHLELIDNGPLVFSICVLVTSYAFLSEYPKAYEIQASILMYFENPGSPIS